MFGYLLQTLTYDPVRDFSPITVVNLQPNIVVVHPSLRGKGPLRIGHESVAGSVFNTIGQLQTVSAAVQIVRIRSFVVAPFLGKRGRSQVAPLAAVPPDRP